MRGPIVGWTSTAPSSSATNYINLLAAGGASWNTSPDVRANVAPHAMTIDSLRVTLGTAPGSGKSWDVTLMVNGVASALTVNIANTATQGQDTSHTVSIAAGDYLSLKFVPTGTPTATGTVQWNIMQEAASLFAVMGSVTSPPTAAGTNYWAPQGRTANASSQQLGEIIIPSAGVLKNLRIFANGSPGASTGWALTLVKNGVDQTLTANLSGTNTTASDLSNTVSVSAGDKIVFKVVTTGAPASRTVAFAMTFQPTTDGESFLSYSNWAGSNTTTTAARYQAATETGDALNATESNVYTRLPALTVKALYARTSVSPGVSPRSYVFTLRKEAADTTATVTINDASTVDGSARSGNITGLSISVANDDRLDMAMTPSATAPSAVQPEYSILTYIAPSAPAATNSNFFALMR